MMTKKSILLFFAFLIIFALGNLSYICYAMEEKPVANSSSSSSSSSLPAPTTTSSTTMPHDNFEYRPNYQIRYQATPQIPKYLEITYNIINQNFDNIEKVLAENFESIKDSDGFLLDTMSDQSQITIKAIAQMAQVEPQFVQLYFSRAIAAKIKNCPSQREMYEKHRYFSSYLTQKEKTILLPYAQIENYLLLGIYAARNHLTKAVAYQDKAPEWIFFPSNKEDQQRQKALDRAHIRCNKHLITNKKNLKYLDEVKAMLSEDRYLKSDELCQRSLKRAHTLANNKNNQIPPFGYRALYTIYQNLVISVASNLRAKIQVFADKFSDEYSWPKVPPCCLKNLIVSIIGKAKPYLQQKIHAKERFDQHLISHIVQLNIDTEINSMVINLSQMIFAVEHIISILLENAGNLPNDTVEAIQHIQRQKARQRELLNYLNTFLAHYESEFIPFDKHIREQGIGGNLVEEGGPSVFFCHDSGGNIPEFTKQRLLNVDKEIDETTVHDSSYIDYLRYIYNDDLQFVDHVIDHIGSDETPQPQKKSKKKQKKARSSDAPLKSDDTCEHEKTTIPEATESLPETSPLQTERRQRTIERLNQLSYHPRIRRWFNPQFASAYPEESRLYHTFAPCADACIFFEGKHDHWPSTINPGQLNHKYSMPGKIIHADGSEHFVIFSCTMDTHNCCYHRGFDYTTEDEIRQSYGITIPEDEVPCDEELQHVSHHDRRIIDRTTIEVNNRQLIRIYDHNNHATIILYQIQS